MANGRATQLEATTRSVPQTTTSESQTGEPWLHMVQLATRSQKCKVDKLVEADLEENKNCSPSEASGDGEAEDGAGNLPTPSKGKKKRKGAPLTQRKAHKPPVKTKKAIPVVDIDEESESSDEEEVQNQSVLHHYFLTNHFAEWIPMPIRIDIAYSMLYKWYQCDRTCFIGMTLPLFCCPFKNLQDNRMRWSQ